MSPGKLTQSMGTEARNAGFVAARWVTCREAHLPAENGFPENGFNRFLELTAYAEKAISFLVAMDNVGVKKYRRYCIAPFQCDGDFQTNFNGFQSTDPHAVARKIDYYYLQSLTRSWNKERAAQKGTARLSFDFATCTQGFDPVPGKLRIYKGLAQDSRFAWVLLT
jgi:hypothetical protein